MAASSRICPIGLKVAITVVFIIFSNTIFLMPSDGAVKQQSEMVLGSKPPGCVNKCLSCRPCMATLVIPSTKWKNNFKKVMYRGDEDDSYYLLAWKCKCGDKLFQP
ncbi:epidermal patterning factor like 8 [Hibiscus trionum]|uniref:Epidermal patterning factor-like protein n=1 Tax=Hibiscus trionum TaxID=183268 RepID=A0A9W7M895_HIBTR|nr:epidermal patterning factor like 8 [Hibiscus trionum]